MAADKVLVLGHTGLVGRAVMAASGGRYLAPAGGRREFDLTRPRSMQRLLERTRPAAVINCAGFTDVDACESQPELAMAVNAAGPEALAAACARVGAHLVHLSTDFVFGPGHRRPISESDPPAPLNHYGRSKLAGERRAAAAWDQCLVVRVAWVFGPAKPTMVDKMLARARRGEKLRVVTDQVGSPSYSRDLAPVLLELARRRVTGILHLVNQGQVSRFGLVVRALELAGLDPALAEPVDSRELGLPARRPEYSVLDCRRLRRVYPAGLPAWTDALARHLGVKPEGDND